MKQEIELNVSAKSSLSDILFNIRLAGYGYVCVEYSGAGDSGSIDDLFVIEKEYGQQDEAGIINLTKSLWDIKRFYLPSEIRQTIEDAVDGRILSDGADWYNNDGGGGFLIICTEDGHYYDDRYVNIVSQEYYSDKGNILK